MTNIKRHHFLLLEYPVIAISPISGIGPNMYPANLPITTFHFFLSINQSMKSNEQNCELVFVRNSKLREHQSDKHTNTTTNTTKQSSSTPSKHDSKYTCKLCGQVIPFLFSIVVALNP